ncbi:TPA: hypothetical protein N0F65_002121 [Lagenidium giganteum]|uniref:Alpha/beta hydrolase n=1 Tax=Lagenidium giganteum TaxID=4803 RepID=A0AAV2ZEJ4_9STRA|nr:TPA: hypothetical protein N0F65_002121 [Lagenidium giganteum]
MLVKLKPWLLSAAIAGGIAGVILHIVFQVVGGPTYLQNQTLGMWGALVLTVFAAQALDDLKKPLYRITKHRKWQLLYNIVILTAAVIVFLCYAIGQRGTPAGWMVALIIVQALNLHTLKVRGATQDNLPIHDINHHEKQVDPPQPAERQPVSCITTCCRCCNVCCLALMLLIMLLLIAGAQTFAQGPIKYPARGKMVEITLADGSGRKHQVHVRCDGPKNASFPVIIMESDGTHGMLDFMTLQLQFTANGRRSCIWDKPGLGYSDVRYAKKDDAEQFLPPLIDALGEQPPYIFLGRGGGGLFVYRYATMAPEKIHSLVFLEVYPEDVEFFVEQRVNNWTDKETISYRDIDLAGRQSLLGIINFVGVPLGLMKIFILQANTTPPSLAPEMQWYMLTDKTWTNQQFYLADIQTVSMYEPSVFEKYPDSAAECDKRVRRNAVFNEYKLGLLKYSGNRSASVMVNCTMDKCDMDWANPRFTTDAIEHIYAGVTLPR